MTRMSQGDGAMTVSQHVLQTLATHGEPITINALLKLIHARHYEDEIVYRGIILTLINLGEIGIDGETMMLSLGQRRCAKCNGNGYDYHLDNPDPLAPTTYCECHYGKPL